MGTILCHYCKHLSAWVRPDTGVRMCESCARAMSQEDWTELARRQLHEYPEEWVGDVAAFIQMSTETRSSLNLEPVVPLLTCDGCKGSLCGKAHSWRQVLPVATVVAQNPKEAR